MKKYNFKENTLINILFSAVLVSIPLPYIINSISIILLIVVFGFLYYKNFNIKWQWYLVVPILYFIILSSSIFFVYPNPNFEIGFQKSLPILVFPLLFLNKSFTDSLKIKQILLYYSTSQVLYALFYILKALLKFIETKNKDVFYFQNLVGIDQNAIYFSVYATLAMFFFYTQRQKNTYYRICLFILLFFLFLLSSKTLIFINIICYVLFYFFFSDSKKSVKVLTFICSGIFLLFSIYFVPQVNQRLKEEYQTAFVDNTINKAYSNPEEKTFNISLNEAWGNKKFKKNQFFPGTAYRVFHVRIFDELISQNNNWLFGFGLNNVDLVLQNEYKKYNVFLNQDYQNFHNQYIQTFAETGFFSFLILIGLVLTAIIYSIKNNNFLGLVFAITMLLLFFTESFLIRQRGIVFFISFYCLFNLSKNYSKKS